MARYCVLFLVYTCKGGNWHISRVDGVRKVVRECTRCFVQVCTGSNVCVEDRVSGVSCIARLVRVNIKYGCSLYVCLNV